MRIADLAEGQTLVCGFGREGRALERVVLAHCPGARVRVCCDQPPARPPERWPVETGGLAAISPRPDRVLRSPGFPVDHPVLEDWRRAGVEVRCISSLWFGERSDARVIAVTGSKGKSTTATLIAEGLRAAGRTVALGGNIGVPMLDLLEQRAEWFVVELSSYQLADLAGHVDLGVVTRLFPEHQDWHGDAERYYAAKERLFELAGSQPVLINAADALLMQRFGRHPNAVPVNGPDGLHAREDGVWEGERRRWPGDRIRLPGRHNLDNIVMALEAVIRTGADPSAALARMAGFSGLPHRLERIEGPARTVWFNDSISTTPHATLAALQSVPWPPVLICGGYERGADWNEVAALLRERPPAGLIALPDNGARIVAELSAAGAVPGQRVALAGELSEAVHKARDWVPPGGCVLFSPGAPSFPHFRDFEHRGECFRALVARLRAD